MMAQPTTLLFGNSLHSLPSNGYRKLPTIPGRSIDRWKGNYIQFSQIFGDQPTSWPHNSNLNSSGGFSLQRHALENGDYKILSNSEQIVNYATECILRELRSTGEPMELDLTKRLEEVLTDFHRSNDTILMHFIETYVNQQMSQPLNSCHKPIIELLSSILSMSRGNVLEMNVCSHIFSILVLFEDNLVTFFDCNVPPLLLGCLTLHVSEIPVRYYCVSTLAYMAAFERPDSLRPILRESCLDILKMNLTNFWQEAALSRKILRTLSNMTFNSYACCDRGLSDHDLPAEVRQSFLMQHLTVLKEIKVSLMPLVMHVLEQHPKDLGIQIEGQRMVNFYQSPEDRVGKLQQRFDDKQTKRVDPILKSRPSKSANGKRVSFFSHATNGKEAS